jgi:pimeloyl-ACP methyl ester carboxylesterase
MLAVQRSLYIMLQVAALAAAGYYVIVPDMPGYGQSDKPSDAGVYSLKHVCSVLCGVLDALGVQAACVVGHDWGAATAWALALQHPQRVSRLVVLSVGHPGEAAATEAAATVPVVVDTPGVGYWNSHAAALACHVASITKLEHPGNAYSSKSAALDACWLLIVLVGN